MRILVVCSYKNNQDCNISPFVKEQCESLQAIGCEIRYFLVKTKGVHGYIKALPALRKCVRDFKPNVIHSHFGFCGLLSNLQRIVPVVTTYHGCDVQAGGLNLFLSKVSMWLSGFNIFVSERMFDIASYKGSNYKIIPCGIDLHLFKPIPKQSARAQLGWKADAKIVQFASSFSITVKNYPLAKETMDYLSGYEIKELKDMSREEVRLALCAADCLLLTSFREGSPMVIKEAMACNCPVVSVDVGDVCQLLNGVENSFIVPRTPNKISDAIKRINGRSNGRNKIISCCLDNDSIAKQLMEIYNMVKQ